MTSIWHLRLTLALLAILTSAVWLAAARPTAAEAPAQHHSLAGQLLVAAPSMGDPRFARTVILMVRHDNNGAFGIVVNRLFGERSHAALLELLGEKDANVTGSVRIFAGGPVQPELGFIIHSIDYQGQNTVAIDAHLAVTSSRDILHDIATGKGPQKSLIAFGYSGWAPGQLEYELRRRDWVASPTDLKLIFDEDREKVWEAAYAQRTQDL